MPNSDSSRFWLTSEVVLGSALVLLPACLGGAPEWTLWLLLALPAGALGTWLVGAARNHRRATLHPVLLVPALFIATGLLQLVPLPPWLLTQLAPSSAELREFTLVPLGLEAWRSVSLDPPATARGVARALGLAMLTFVALQLGRLRATRRRLLVVLALAGVTTAIVGFVHLIAGLDLFFGVYDFVGNPALLTPFGNTNHLAAWLLLTGTVGLGLALSASVRDEALGWGLVAMVIGVAVFLTLSRGGIATFVVTWCLVGASVLARRAGGLKATVPWLLMGATVTVALLLSLEQLVERADTVSTLKKLSSTKLDLWPMFARGLLPSWPLGVGLGAFELAQTSTQTEEFLVSFTHPEMIGLQWLADLGAPVALTLIGLLAWSGVRMWRGTATLPAERALLIGLAGLVLHDLFDFALELNAVGAAAAIGLGLVASVEEGSTRWSVKRAGLAWGALPIAGMLVALSYGLPSHLAAERRLAQLARAGAAYEEVRDLALKLIARHPSDWVLYATVAQVASVRADPLEALAWVNRVLQLRPIDARSHVSAGQALLRLGRPLQALAEFKLAWERGDGGSLELGLAIADRERAWDRVLLAKRGHLTAAYVLLSSRQRDAQALALVEAARQFPPSDEVAEEAQSLLAQREAASGEPSNALEALAALPPEVQLRSELVLAKVGALRRMGRVEEGISELSNLLKREPANLRVGFLLVETLAAQGRLTQAREALHRVKPFAGEPAQRSAIYVTEAQLWLHEERFPRALDALQTASRIEPTRADLHYRLAEVYERMGSAHSALDEVRRGRLLDTPEGAKRQDAWIGRLEASMLQLP